MSLRKGWIAGLLLFLVCVLLSGLSVSLATVDDGIAEIEDPRLQPMAARSLALASRLADHPIERLVFPASRIESIDLRPGHCGPREPGSTSPDADYVATVRFYTVFAIPGPSVTSRCGGHYAIKHW